MRIFRTALWALFFVALAATNSYGQGVVETIVPNNYHYQVYNNWCGSASIEMMLDCPAVVGNNTWLSTSSFADAPAVAAGGVQPTPTFQLTGGVNYVSSNMQAFIYGLNHGANTFNGVGYYNYAVPYGVGTDSGGVVADLQLIDNPAVNGLTGPAFGNHAYAGFNLAPSLAGAAQATRTIANCMAQYDVPAQIVVENGAHSIIANGVETTGMPGVNQQYTINYVQVSDPWTGYALQQPASSNGSLGLGFNTWLRYGYDVLGNGQGIAIVLPNGNIVQNARLGAWFNYYNVSPGQASPGFQGPGYKFTVEPQGPEALDTGDPSNDGSLPAPPALLMNPLISGSQAYASAMSDLAGDSKLTADMGIMGAHLDANFGDDMMFQMPGGQGDGDWLVPYDGSGGVNDVTGAILIDADTGVIDEATWIDPGDNMPSGFSLTQIDALFNDEALGHSPDDFSVVAPEPGTLSLLVVAGALAPIGYSLRRRRRLQAVAKASDFQQ